MGYKDVFQRGLQRCVANVVYRSGLLSWTTDLGHRGGLQRSLQR